MLESGLHVVKNMPGHANLSTALIYSHFSLSALRENVSRI